jgi:hypothetical protein
METSEHLDKFGPALNGFHSDYLGAIKKDGRGNFGKFPDLGAAIKATKPALAANGLSIIQSVRGDASLVVVETIILHSSGQFIATSLPMPVDENHAKRNAAWALGAATSYGRRYGYFAALQLFGSDEIADFMRDTDGKPDPRALEAAPTPPPAPEMNTGPFRTPKPKAGATGRERVQSAVVAAKKAYKITEAFGIPPSTVKTLEQMPDATLQNAVMQLAAAKKKTAKKKAKK